MLCNALCRVLASVRKGLYFQPRHCKECLGLNLHDGTAGLKELLYFFFYQLPSFLSCRLCEHEMMKTGAARACPSCALNSAAGACSHLSGHGQSSSRDFVPVPGQQIGTAGAAPRPLLFCRRRFPLSARGKPGWAEPAAQREACRGWEPCLAFFAFGWVRQHTCHRGWFL